MELHDTSELLNLWINGYLVSDVCTHLEDEYPNLSINELHEAIANKFGQWDAEMKLQFIDNKGKDKPKPKPKPKPNTKTNEDTCKYAYKHNLSYTKFVDIQKENHNMIYSRISFYSAMLDLAIADPK